MKRERERERQRERECVCERGGRGLYIKIWIREGMRLPFMVCINLKFYLFSSLKKCRDEISPLSHNTVFETVYETSKVDSLKKMISKDSFELYAHKRKFDESSREFVYGKAGEWKRGQTLGDYVAAMESRERETFRSAQEIVPRLFLGPQTAAFWSWREKFTHYLSMNGADPTRQIISKENMMIVDSLDDVPSSSPTLERILRDCVNWIVNALRDKSSKVLVFCTAGRSRSASIILAYLMITRKLVLLEALEIVRSKRPWIQPNSGYINVLMKLESELLTTRTIPHMPHCELCMLKCKTTWIEMTSKYVILICDQCEQPMAVWRSHVTSINQKDSVDLESALRRAADKHFGASDIYYVDKVQRSIYTHLHWHARKHNRMSRVLEQHRKRRVRSVL